MVAFEPRKCFLYRLVDFRYDSLQNNIPALSRRFSPPPTFRTWDTLLIHWLEDDSRLSALSADPPPYVTNKLRFLGVRDYDGCIIQERGE